MDDMSCLHMAPAAGCAAWSLHVRAAAYDSRDCPLGSCHCRWACTPKGAAFLWAARRMQAALLPPVTSHGYGLVSFGHVV